MLTRNRNMEELRIFANMHANEKTYWLNKLSGDIDRSSFYNQSSVINYNQETLQSKLSNSSYERIRLITGNNDEKLLLFLLTGVMILLTKYNNNEDIVIGTPIIHYSNTGEKELINTMLPIRCFVDQNKSFKETLLNIVQPSFVEALKNSNYPLGVLIEDLNISTGDYEFALFDTVVVLNNIQEEKAFEHLYPGILFSFTRDDNGLGVKVAYNSYKYSRQLVKQLVNHFENLIGNIISNSDNSIRDINIIEDDEKQQILALINGASKANYTPKRLIELFESQAKKNRDKVMLSLMDSQLTYGELNRKSNQLARILRNHGVGPNTIVALVFTRSVNMIISILGVLKSGGAYLPIDPDNPKDRIQYILNDSNSDLILTENNVLKNKSFTFLTKRQNTKLKCLRTATREQIKILDDLCIPDRSLVNYEKYNNYIGLTLAKNVVAIQATRGCPYSCAYCHKIWPKSHIFRSAVSIFKEVHKLYNLGVRRFAFIDDIFNLNRKNSTDFFNLVISNNLDIQIFFPNGIRGDILTEDYIDLMVEAGSVHMGLALETASPRIQKLIGKNLNLEKFRSNVEYICTKYPQVITDVFIMIGFPSESEEEVKMTLDFVKSLNWIHFPYLHILKIYQNTDIESIALNNGVSRQDIIDSEDLAFHELPTTLPFSRDFTSKCQGSFFNDYFLSRERLLKVLPYQMRLLSEDEIVQKYNSYLPMVISNLKDLLEFFQITYDELGVTQCCADEKYAFSNIKKETLNNSNISYQDDNVFKILLLDLSQFYSQNDSMLYDVIEPPLGLMYLASHLNEKFGENVRIKIAKSRVDFDSNKELQLLIDEFNPNLIGVRTLNFYKNFFHQTISFIRETGFKNPIIAGGPYATSSYEQVLSDKNIDIVVLGEGEITLGEIVSKLIDNDGKLPNDGDLKNIKGIAFLTSEQYQNQYDRDVVVIDDIEDIMNEHSEVNLNHTNSRNDIAYVIYTSGTTGNPKGVLISDYNVVRLLDNDKFKFYFSNADIWTLFHSYNFDFSVWEMYGAFLYGGKLIVVTKSKSKNIGEYYKLLGKERVTVLNQTPTVFYKILKEDSTVLNSRLNLKYVIFGGEMLNPSKLEVWYKKYPDTKLINMFGITETTVHVTFKELHFSDLTAKSVIGNPIPTLNLYILDKYQNLLAREMTGELCVGGDGLGRGYMNIPELTSEKFISYKENQGEIIYRSGDFAKLNFDDNIEYIGRNDEQIKIRGFRIELGEIENQILKYEAIDDVRVLSKKLKNEEKILVAFYISEDEIIIDDLKAFLKKRIPSYMLPNTFVKVDRIPLTSNGKINQKALLAIKIESTITELTNPIENKLAEIISKIISIDSSDFEINSNFFELGGNSLNAIDFIGKINKVFSVSIPIKDIFNNITIKEIGKLIAKSSKQDYKGIKPSEKKEYYLLTSSQKRIYYQQQKFIKSTNYNIPICVTLTGKININKIRNVLSSIFNKHEIFRTTFHTINGKPAQIVSNRFCHKIEHVKGSGEFIQKRRNTFVNTFDLRELPLVRAELMEYSSETAYLLMDFHHIIFDASAMNLFLGEFKELYNSGTIDKVTLQYKDYVNWQNVLMKSDTYKKSEEYWLNKLKNYCVTDLERENISSNINSKVKISETEVDGVLAKSIQDYCNNKGVSKFVFLYAAFITVLSKETSLSDLTLGIPVQNKDHAGLEFVMGSFLNVLLVRNNISPNDTLASILQNVKHEIADSMENKIFPYEVLNLKLQEQEGFENRELFNILFNYNYYEEDNFKINNDLKIETNKMDLTDGKYNITVYIADFAKKILISVIYNNSYQEYRITRVMENFIHIIQLYCADDNVRFDEVKFTDIIDTNDDEFESLYKDSELFM